MQFKPSISLQTAIPSIEAPFDFQGYSLRADSRSAICMALSLLYLQGMCQTQSQAEGQRSFSLEALKQNSKKDHTHCIACSMNNPVGLKLQFEVSDNGSVTANFRPGEIVQGYNGLVQGGVIATLLDAAMTNCLFAHGIVALTAELVIRYKSAVVIGVPLQIRAWRENNSKLLYCMAAELVQNSRVKATAKAKFLNKP
jgi:acyl-coenzyme A thioesterase PaaI-like protein